MWANHFAWNTSCKTLFQKTIGIPKQTVQESEELVVVIRMKAMHEKFFKKLLKTRDVSVVYKPNTLM